MVIPVTAASILLTVGVYMLSRKVGKRFPSPFTTPVFFSTTILICIFLLGGVSYEQYEPAKEIMTYLLGPATAALAVPLYKNRKLIMEYSLIWGAGLVLGSLAAILSITAIAKLSGLSDSIVASLTVKSATVPIAVETTTLINGDPSLAAAFVVATGTIGGMVGPWLLTRLNISHPVSRGLSMGTIAHGQGTAEIAREGQLQGAMAGTAMGLAAIFISIVVPLLF
ncbi:LrgB family protein [Bacillus sp. FJAT-44742]|uniref:LrgB family protein n=1 Tax=Bacillus sp. FJAT-44742 TaxID=2014005 RepID=UPI000C23FDAB|nr:LrgB family protein [Bacillus sp. FJAT-44742]